MAPAKDDVWGWKLLVFPDPHQEWDNNPGEPEDTPASATCHWYHNKFWRPFLALLRRAPPSMPWIPVSLPSSPSANFFSLKPRRCLNSWSCNTLCDTMRQGDWIWLPRPGPSSPARLFSHNASCWTPTAEQYQMAKENGWADCIDHISIFHPSRWPFHIPKVC